MRLFPETEISRMTAAFAKAPENKNIKKAADFLTAITSALI
jgi:hypothetical protein